jgi:hypothetical protein
MTQDWKAAAIRAARTFAQTFIGVFLAGIIATETTALSSFANLALLDQAIAAGLVAVLSFAQNALEGWGRVEYDRG